MVTLKGSEDIKVAQLAALRQGSKEAKVPGSASIWNSQSSWPYDQETNQPPYSLLQGTRAAPHHLFRGHVNITVDVGHWLLPAFLSEQTEAQRAEAT